MIVNSGTRPIAVSSPHNAEANLVQFVRDITVGRTVDRVMVRRATEMDHDIDGPDGRYGYAVDIMLGSDTDQATSGTSTSEGDMSGRVVTFKVAMPGLPLDQVNYGARPEDKTGDFPRLHLDGGSYWWRHAVRTLTGHIRDAAQATGPRLGWGYNKGLRGEQVAAAWGARANVTQAGSVDLIHDRQSTCGDRAAVASLLAKLNGGGLNAKWINTVVQLIRDYEMGPHDDREFVLLDEDSVIVKGMRAGAYLYVCAYTLTTNGIGDTRVGGR